MRLFEEKIPFAAIIFFSFFFTFFLNCDNSAKIGTANKNLNNIPPYFASIDDNNDYKDLTGGEALTPLITITNYGTEKWESDFTNKNNPARLSYHLWKNENIIDYDGLRTQLPCDIEYGKSISIHAAFKAPSIPGNYIIEWDLVREGISWFQDMGSKTKKIEITVKDIFSKNLKPISLIYNKKTSFITQYEEINKLQFLIEKTLQLNAKKYNGQTGTVNGFGAGNVYPELWARDNSTIIQASRYYYPKEFLNSWIEEHLVYQKENGSLQDWIKSDGSHDKNTIETDQEDSIVHAAYQYYKITGDKTWLLKPIKGISIIDRLEKSLEYLLQERFNGKYGLITGGHTADWGDVGFEYPDQKAIYADGKTHWTVDIYDQTMFYRSAIELSELFLDVGKKERVSFWLNVARDIQEKTNEHLWQEDKGFFRMHRHIDSLNHHFNEDDIFPLGGNTMAIKSGLASAKQAGGIFQTATERQRIYNISTIGASLLPPYPKSFFSHSILDEPFEYQNGGQWDWFAGRFITMEFEHGRARIALKHLLEVASKDVNNRGLHEWDDKKGAGQGSSYYAGSAGALAEAIFNGYFGVYLSFDNLKIAPRLGSNNGAIQLYQPATDSFFSYNYEFIERENLIIIKYSHNIAEKVLWEILLPDGFKATEVRINDRNIAFYMKQIVDDHYLCFDNALFNTDINNINVYGLIE